MNKKFLLKYESILKEKIAKDYDVSSDDIVSFRDDPILGSECDLLYEFRKFYVKLSRPVITGPRKRTRIWDFDFRRERKLLPEEATYYILVGLEGDVIQKVFKIPHLKVLSQHVRISITGESKYSYYEI